MCGILGYFFRENYKLDEESFLKGLAKLERRGPDFNNYIISTFDDRKLFLGHTRLSILELSELGNQPYSDHNNALVFNGEIYNHNTLRNNLGFSNTFKSSSDTETLFYLLKNNKTEDVLLNVQGMFSFIFLDRKKNKLIIARDRTGEKPLYIYNNNNCLAFSSDLSALKVNKKNSFTINKNSVAEYLNYQYIPNPETIYNECYKLPPASLIEIDLLKYNFNNSYNYDNFISIKGVNYKKWWNLEFNEQIYNNKNYLEVKNNTEKVLTESVKKQLISDVPLGAFLSSGIDSSLLVSLMQSINSNTKTFTIGYEKSNLSEAHYAKKIASHLGTDHHELIFTSKDLLSIVDKMPEVYSEPFADSSQIPTFMVSKLASQKVKVALSGDGGDEIFGGYNRYILANKFWPFYKLLPKYFKNQLLNLFSKFPQSFLKLYFKKYTNNINKILYKLKKIDNEADYYFSMTNEWQNLKNIISFDFLNETRKKEFNQSELNYFEKKMMMYDFNTYLTDDILCKVDRASMYHSLETRAPFLDPEVVNYCYNINDNFIFREHSGKFILKDILSKYLPEHLISKKKMGFAIPISEWLQNELYNWAGDYLTEEMCDKHKLFKYNTISKLYSEKHNIKQNSIKIWSIIQFNKWYSEIYN